MHFSSQDQMTSTLDALSTCSFEHQISNSHYDPLIEEETCSCFPSFSRLWMPRPGSHPHHPLSTMTLDEEIVNLNLNNCCCLHRTKSWPLCWNLPKEIRRRCCTASPRTCTGSGFMVSQWLIIHRLGTEAQKC